MSLAKSLRHRADLLSAFFHCFAFFFCRACKTKTDACSLPFVLLFYFSTLLSRSFLMPFDATHAGPCVGRGGGGVQILRFILPMIDLAAGVSLSDNRLSKSNPLSLGQSRKLNF